MIERVRQPVVIIGIGNSLRHDDGVGGLVIDALANEPVTGCDLVVLSGEATSVIDAWCGRDLAIVVDAVCTGEPAGTIHDRTLDRLDGSQAPQSATSSHYAGLAEALELGSALDRLPRVVRVIGIEPGDLTRGLGLSPAVAASMNELVTRVRNATIAAAARKVVQDASPPGCERGLTPNICVNGWRPGRVAHDRATR